MYPGGQSTKHPLGAPGPAPPPGQGEGLSHHTASPQTVQFGNHSMRKDIKLLENSQRKATKMVKGLEDKTYKLQLRPLGLVSTEQRS